MKKTYEQLPKLSDRRSSRGHVGIIGCGNFAFSTIAYYISKNYGRVIRGAMDINPNRAASLYERYKLDYFTDDARKIIQDPQIDLVFIASNHASHAEYAIAALEAGKSVHIEKPHVVSEEQLQRLCGAMESSSGKVGLGFNRPNSRIGREIKKHLDGEEGAAMFSWFIAGHKIDPDHWYFKEEEGGRILGNLCHWTDFVLQMVPEDQRFPMRIVPARAEKSDCDIAVDYVFADGTIAAITFSAKGHTFEGVKERFAAHRGDVLIAMDDFKHLVVDKADRKIKISPMFRDHGHEEAVRNSYRLTQNGEKGSTGCSTQYVWETGMLFLQTRRALEEQRTVSLSSYESASA